jgi:hypothetical protein
LHLVLKARVPLFGQGRGFFLDRLKRVVKLRPKRGQCALKLFLDFFRQIRVGCNNPSGAAAADTD